MRSTFRLSPERDWRYAFLQPHPVVIPPPARFKIDPYYTKFSWAREFTVLGRNASDEAMLRANDTIRKLFAYRHDILKSLMAEDVKLIVLGREERLADLPEIRSLADKGAIDLTARCLEYSPSVKLLVVPEENVIDDRRGPDTDDDAVIRVLAGALYQVAGKRPVDPDWESRPRNVWQQYELRLQRLDQRFDERLVELHGRSLANGRWKGTAAVHDPARYWLTGVLAYFDAAGQYAAPIGEERPVVSREALRQYDLDLYTLIHETFAYGGKPDWRVKH